METALDPTFCLRIPVSVLGTEKFSVVLRVSDTLQMVTGVLHELVLLVVDQVGESGIDAMLPHQTAIQVSLPVATARRGREDQHEHVIVELAIRNRHRNGSFVDDPSLVPDPAGNIPEFREWILDRDREPAAGGPVGVECRLGYRPAPGIHGNDFCRDAFAKGMGEINLPRNHLANLVPRLIHRDVFDTLFVFHSQASGRKIDHSTSPVEQADIDQVVTTRQNRQSEFG